VITCEPDGRAISEYGEDTCMEYFTPVGEVQTPDRVAQDGQRHQGGPCARGHDGNVSSPGEGGGEEDAQVMDQSPGRERELTKAGISNAKA
jgi:hypothetical protein